MLEEVDLNLTRVYILHSAQEAFHLLLTNRHTFFGVLQSKFYINKKIYSDIIYSSLE